MVALRMGDAVWDCVWGMPYGTAYGGCRMGMALRMGPTVLMGWNEKGEAEAA